MRKPRKAKRSPFDLSHLTGLEFQKRVFDRLVQQLFDNPDVITIENCGKGAVDYIVREHPGSGILATDRFHYFECKNYSRSLELDNVAKVMVVAVSEQPLSVHVVSRTPLQPQIRKYASRLFSFEGSVSPIFRSVAFRHWQTGALVGDDNGAHEGASGIADELSLAADAANTVHWWLSECAAFSELEIASSATARQSVHVRHGALLILSLETSDAKSTDVFLDGLPEGAWRYVELLDDSGSGHYLIDTSLLGTGEDYRVAIRMVQGESDRRIPLVHLQASGVASFLPELRIDEIDDLVKKMGPSDDVRLTLVDGEAGVGKTHLIEKVAEGLRTKSGFDILRFTVPEEPDDELMASIIRNCLAPAIEKSAFGGLVDQIESSLLQQESGGNLQVDFRLLARVASQMGPRMIVLRDCHLVTSKLADEIWMLISTLDDFSWGGIRLVLEYRQPDADANTAFQGLLRQIRLKIRRVLLEKTILPLGRDAFHRFCKHLFAFVTDDLIVCLFNRTGGVPLFIDSYLHRLHDLKLIRRRDVNPPFEIDEPARILADALPAGRQIILEERVRMGLAAAYPKDWENWAIILGLIATADNALGQSLILRAIDISESESRMLPTTLRDAGIGSLTPDGQIVFCHDLLREAVAAVATATTGFESKSRDVANRLLDRAAPTDEVKVRAIRVKIFALLGDNVACELELRNALTAANQAHDYGRIVSFLNQLLPLLKDHRNSHERLLVMKQLAWANWVTDSLVVARERYLRLAEEAERNAEGDYALSDAIATDAYRRAIGLDLELMEPYVFVTNAIMVLNRRQDHVSFNSILNRLVLFCARFGLPLHGFQFARLSFNYIGDGSSENEGSVLCNELGMLYAASSPAAALELFEQAHAMAHGLERIGSKLAVHVNECLYHGRPLDPALFDALWAECTERRLAEPLARASLLKGSLLLRDGNLKSAAHWIERTATMVQLYHMKQFELAILNDQVLLALLSNNMASATDFFNRFVSEFSRIESETIQASKLVDTVLEAAEMAAAQLVAKPSDIRRPETPPEFCNPAAEVRHNIGAFAALLGLDEIAQSYISSSPPYLFAKGSEHRQVEVGGHRLILGAY